MAKAAHAIPPGFRTVQPHLVVRGAARAIEFYQRAFGAEEVSRAPMPGGDLLMHAEVRIGDSIVMLVDELPQMRYWVSPQQLQGTSVGISLHVEDADAWFERAVAAGCEVSLPIMDAFWGDRYAKVRDPFGHEWEIVTHQEDLTPEAMAERAQAFFAQLAKGDSGG